MQDNAEVKSITKPWLTKENYEKVQALIIILKMIVLGYDTSGETATHLL